MKIPMIFFAGLCSFGAAIVLFVWAFIQFTPEDTEEYRSLIESTGFKKISRKNSSQKRTQVQKDILFTQGSLRLQLRLIGSDAELLVLRKNQKAEIVEIMKDVICFMQEDLYYLLPDGHEAFLQSNGKLLISNADPKNESSWLTLDSEGLKPMQIIRYIEAEHAKYYYQTDLLVAEKVQLSRFIVPGHQLIDSTQGLKPIMQAFAKSIEFSLEGVILKGGVAVEHELGKINAEEIVIKPDRENKKHHFRFFAMKDNVKIKMKDGGELKCATALLDNVKHSGRFSGDPEQEYVTYSESYKDKKGTQASLKVKSRMMNIQIAKHDITTSAKSFISSITAENDVTVDYDQEFLAKADYGIYERSSQEISDELIGTIVLKGSGGEGKCEVENRNGDVIKAEQIIVETSSRKMHFSNPKGVLLASYSSTKKEQIDFSCKALTWVPNQDQLALRENVVVYQSGFGQILNQKEIIICKSKKKNKTQLGTIETIGETQLIFFDKNGIDVHELTCYGKVIVDHEKLHTTLESPTDAQGNVIKGKQIFFHDRYGEIYADKAVLGYDCHEGKIILSKILLEGHVRILNRISLQTQEKGAFLQYALADQVEYIPENKEMFLQASSPGKRVLFYDKINNIHMSAHGIKIKRDMQTNKDSVHGIGDVRFNFIDKEQAELRSQFGEEEER